MEPRTKILFISYIVIVLAIIAIGVVPYFVKGEYKNDTLVVETEPVALADEADDNFIGTVRVIDTNTLTHAVRFELVDDKAFFEQASERLFNIMNGRTGNNIVISYKKADLDGNVCYNFSESLEVLPNR